ncbi:MAG: hypothetical protein ACOYPR_16655 [Saprospiraceae bacterium]
MAIPSVSDVDLYFTPAGGYLFRAYHIGIGDLPAAVTAALSSQYSGYTPVNGKVYRVELPGRGIQYKVRTVSTTNPNDRLDLLFDANGVVVCVLHD